MKTGMVCRALGLTLILLATAACGGSSVAAPLDPGDLNLVFVVSPDLAFQSPGDLHPDTANLTGQGLRRSLLLAEFLKQQVLGGHNVNGIHALAPMTHLQTAGRYPDMAAMAFVQQFSVLNQTTQLLATGGAYTGNNVPINVAYSPGSLPAGVAAPAAYCPDCNGLVFADATGANLALVSRIIGSNRSGYFVLSAPWETVSALLADLNHRYGDVMEVPIRFQGSNLVYAVSIPAAGNPRLETFACGAVPEAAYPVLPAPVPILASTSTRQAAFSTTRTGGVAGALLPANSNRNQKIHIIRHAEAHPDPATQFEDGNLVGAGQWRALALPAALEGKLQPDLVCSIDPAQWYFSGHSNVAYVRPSLTVLPYVVARNLPYQLVAGFPLLDPNVSRVASDYFFTGGRFSNRTMLLAWESSRIKPLINALLASYGGSGPLLTPAWPTLDYDTIWTVTLDGQGNVTVDDALGEGIETTLLPVAAPRF